MHSHICRCKLLALQFTKHVILPLKFELSTINPAVYLFTV